MKKYFPFLITLFAVGLLSAGCYKDKGNYNYTAVNTVGIKTTAATDSFIVASGDTLRINIDFTQTIPSPDSSLKYKWIITTPFNTIQPNPQHPNLGTQKNLATQILEIPNNYLVTVEITDQVSGVTFFKTFYVTVTPDALSMNEGWLVLEQFGNGSDVSYIPFPNAGTTLHGIYSLNNAAFLPKDAFSITVVNTARQNPNQEIHILSGTDMVQADYLKLVKVAGYEDLFYAVPTVRKPQTFSARLQTQSTLLLDNNNLYMCVFGTNLPVNKFVGPYTGGIGNTNLKINPHVFCNSGSKTAASGYDSWIVYDDLSQRFLFVYGGSTTINGIASFGLVPVGGAPFDMNNIGKQLLNIDNTVDGFMNEFNSTFFALFKNNKNDSLFLYQVINKTGSNNLPTYQNNAIAVYSISSAPGLATAKNFTSSDYAYQVYYESGSDIYVLNAKSGIAHIVYSFPAGTQINIVKLFKPQYITAPTYAPGDCTVLAVATQESGQGKLYTFNLTSAGEVSGSTYSNVYSGFGNIKDLAFKKVAGK